MKIITKSILAGTLLLSSCASTNTSKPEGKIPPAFQGGKNIITIVSPASLLIASFNRNNDYVIDQTEFDNGRAAAFGLADNNKDGKLSILELENWRVQALGAKDALPMSMFFDKDFNQTITHAEFNTALGKLFTQADINNSGSLSFNEMARIAVKPSQRAQRRGKKSGSKKQGQGRGKGRGGQQY